MKRLWAPWRKRYVTHPKSGKCIFCAASRSPRENDRKHLVLRRSRHGFLILNLYPYNNGHVMVCPNRHVPSFEDLDQEETLDLHGLLGMAVKALRKVLRPQGFNVGLNLGRTGGAGFPGHLHLHVVPRWEGDTNFMPVVAGTKVISNSLQDVYGMLSRALPK